MGIKYRSSEAELRRRASQLGAQPRFIERARRQGLPALSLSCAVPVFHMLYRVSCGSETERVEIVRDAIKCPTREMPTAL